MDIDIQALSDPQYFGLACVVDGRVFGPGEHPVQVGYLGDDLHPVHACATPCARQIDRLVMARPKSKHAKAHH